MSFTKAKRFTQPTNMHGCSCCNVLIKQGCSNNIIKNGNKIWYVLHNLVEMMPDKPTDEECANMRITIRTILNSMPCTECKLHSLNWFDERISKYNSRRIKLDTREEWIHALWHHHDTVNKRVVSLNPHKCLSWTEYKKQLEINRITCILHPH